MFTSIGVYFTDQVSLEGINDPSQFARRLALRLPDHDECQRYGCAVIGFDIPDISLVQVPPLTTGTTLGMTATGAREWFYGDNLELSPTMDIIYVDPAPSGPMYYYLPLD